jgi:predicted O-linked N-acetylglucosamine transferase (SPINDLY family)
MVDSVAEAIALHRAGDLAAAERVYRALLAKNADDSVVLALYGTLKGQRAELNDALGLLQRSLRVNPHQPLALNNVGNALKGLGRCKEALPFYDKAIALKPDYAEAYYNKGLSLHVLGRDEEAVASYDRALAIIPAYADAHCAKGTACIAREDYVAALASYGKAIALKPHHAEALQSRMQLLGDLNRPEEALADCETLLRFRPDLPFLPGDHLSLLLDLCNWTDISEIHSRIGEGVAAGHKVCDPFSLLKIETTPEIQRRCAETYVAHAFKPGVPLASEEPYAHERIRIAYLSSDLRNHATAYLLAEVLEKHERARFEVFAFSFGIETHDEMAVRLRNACEHFFDVDGQTDEAIARLVRQHEIDIAIDLKGFTREARTGVFALRPAPIQVNYLGFPGTLGAPYIDYIIADRSVIPPEHVDGFSEKVVYLPHSYQPNDRQRRISDRAPTRTEEGLPARQFVFCCFNNPFKITPDEFDIWMRLLRSNAESVLWLLVSNPTARANLQREAKARGVDPARLVFAQNRPLADHLVRLRLADLFLDTFACNAHTTASDALWAGLPVLTCPGTTFASRVGASLLQAAGLPELIAPTRADYHALALRLSQDRDALAALRNRLAQNLETCPLFDSTLYARHLESAYRRMWERQQATQTPDHIEISASP